MHLSIPESGTGAILSGERESLRVERRPEQLDRFRSNAVELQDFLLTQPCHLVEPHATGGDKRPARRMRKTGGKIAFQGIGCIGCPQTGWSFPHHLHRIACSSPSVQRPSSGGIVACVAFASDFAVRLHPDVEAGRSPLTLNSRTGVRLFDRFRRDSPNSPGMPRESAPSSQRETRKRRRFRGFRSGSELTGRTGCRPRGIPSRVQPLLQAMLPG